MSVALYKRDDFKEIVEIVAEEKGIKNPAIVEKDYFVTEALRDISKQNVDVIFKGGTSLSKGWGLIKRFSEDVDLYVMPAQSKKATEKRLKNMAAGVSGNGAFYRQERTDGINSVARSTRHYYYSKFNQEHIASSVLLEIGIQSGNYPTEERSICSMISESVQSKNIGKMGEDCEPFTMKLLHFRRTFLEKMFALHDKVERGLIKEGREIGTYVRHYYDIYQLLQQADVIDMIKGQKYHDICIDYHNLTRTFYPRQVFPSKLNLSTSIALYPDGEIIERISEEYQRQCGNLCYADDPPTFREVLGALEEYKAHFVDILEK